MKRHDDSQRSDGLPVTFAHPGDPHESLTARRAYASVPHLGFDGSMIRAMTTVSAVVAGDVR